MARWRVGILGATGLVGQHLVARLAAHPWFELRAVGASEARRGQTYGQAVSWQLDGAPPPAAARLALAPCEPGAFEDCQIVFSALAREVALEVEPAFAAAGFAVVSNSAALRDDPDVPLLVPEVNGAHLALLERQRPRWPGCVVTNPNCSTVGLVLSLAPLAARFGVRRAFVATMQAVSGAGLGGPSALELLDNVLPWIPGEEEKIERETRKILGTLGAGGVEPASLELAAHCHRVPVRDGHLEAVSVELDRPASPEEALEAWRAYIPPESVRRLPSAPERTLQVRLEPDRPQPRRDRDSGGGMTVVIGRVRSCPLFTLRYVLLVHNTIRGAAGAALLNAELLAASGLLERHGRP